MARLAFELATNSWRRLSTEVRLAPPFWLLPKLPTKLLLALISSEFSSRLPLSKPPISAFLLVLFSSSCRPIVLSSAIRFSRASSTMPGDGLFFAILTKALRQPRASRASPKAFKYVPKSMSSSKALSGERENCDFEENPSSARAAGWTLPPTVFFPPPALGQPAALHTRYLASSASTRPRGSQGVLWQPKRNRPAAASTGFTPGTVSSPAARGPP
mmetsp:Transcript_35615/g.52055  ORF Transcript_35615/g.52055 Transcript_35615/m.52055 type:complete len:216 (+) Transcript_35615:500-1147(+)